MNSKLIQRFGKHLTGNVSDEERFKDMPQVIKSFTEETVGYFGIVIILASILLGFSLGMLVGF